MKRYAYRITSKEGEEIGHGYLFDDNVRWWLARGYTLTLIP